MRIPTVVGQDEVVYKRYMNLYNRRVRYPAKGDQEVCGPNGLFIITSLSVLVYTSFGKYSFNVNCADFKHGCELCPPVYSYSYCRRRPLSLMSWAIRTPTFTTRAYFPYHFQEMARNRR